MKKKYIMVGLLIIVLLGIVLFYERPVEDALPTLARIDGTLYQWYDYVQEKPENEADGYIIEIVSGTIPKNNQTANFGNVGMPYWKTDNEICIWINDNLGLLRPIQE